MNLRILVAAHKPYWMPDDPVYLPIYVGKALHPARDLGWQGDDTGDNISAKNANYCELTALYWAWKNLDADAVGLVHYRRYFTRREAHGTAAKRRAILTGADWQRLLAAAPIIVPDKRRYYIETNESHYRHAHHAAGLDALRAVLAARHPSAAAAYETVLHRTWAHMFNMFVMRRDLYDAYCAWLFEVLADVEARIDLRGYSPYEARVFGFLSELLLDVWLEATGHAYAEQNVSFLEPQNWLKKGANFLWRKVRPSID